MDNNNHTQKKRFNIYNLKFSTKLYTLVFILVANSIFFTMVVCMQNFKNYSKKENYKRLSQIADVKKVALEKGFAQFYQDFSNSARSDLKYAAQSLLIAYNNFDTYAYSDTLSILKNNLSEYYKDVVIPQIKWQTPNYEDIFPANDKTIILQNLYIAENPYQDQKEMLIGSKSNSEYNSDHIQIHRVARDFARKYQLKNLYIVDGLKGNVIYDMAKSIALGTNLFDGVYKDSKLANVFQKALATENNNVVITDYDYFIPSNNHPVGFAAVSIPDSENNIPIILVAEIDARFFQQFIIDEWMLDKHESISLNLVGKDKYLRTDDTRFIVDPTGFMKKIFAKRNRNQTFNIAYKVGSCTYALKYPESVDLDNRNKVAGKNYLKENAYLYIQPVSLKGLNWYIVAQSNMKKSLSFIKRTYLYILLVAIAILLFSFALLKIGTDYISNRLEMLNQTIRKTANGERVSSNLSSKWNDEIGSTIQQFNLLNEKVQNGTRVALELSEGKFDNFIEISSENDHFANALNLLKETLKKNSEADKKRIEEDKNTTWINEGIAKFNDLLRQSNDNIKELSYIIIENLISYLEINQGGVFLVESDGEDKKSIHLIASYAYDRRKMHTKVIEVGEGLIGNCYLERKPVHLKKIPQDYMEITSGLGQTNPTSLYIVPLMTDNEVLGFIELASLDDFAKHKIDFINSLAENIAATFASVKLNTRTAELLEESKRRANEIAQQEEEMRQNMEEMQATQEELARVREEDEGLRRNLQIEVESTNRMIQQLLNGMDGEVFLTDAEGRIVLANEEAAKRFGSTPEKMKEMTYNQLFTSEKAQREREIDSQVLIEGFFSEESFELIGDKDVKYFVVKKQFFIPNQKETGILTIRSKRS